VVLSRLVTAVATPFGHPVRLPKEDAMSSVSGAAGHAALAICESMLLSLTESKLIDEAEARAILEDAAAAHRNAIPLLADGAAHNAIPLLADGAAHDAAATLIEELLQGGNSVRHA
jgi:hypothetical protein